MSPVTGRAEAFPLKTLAGDQLLLGKQNDAERRGISNFGLLLPRMLHLSDHFATSD